MTTIVTFLGDRGALQTTYSYQGENYTGGVFAEALRQFCEFDRMIVCVTERAKEKTWSVLENLQDSRIQPLPIPTGQDTAEMWQTFEIISKEIHEGEPVIFDITHGLRSLPFLVFLFAAYLKSAKNVSINGIYYGAWELKNSEGIAPVIDLSEFVSMIDWITATTRFTEIGNGQALVDLLRKEIPSPQELVSSREAQNLRASLENTAKAIETISLALSTTRPIEVMESAAKLEATLKRSAEAFGKRARPFQLLSDRVLNEYGQFALNKPKEEDVLPDNLKLQLQMIDWYLKRDNILQAMTLAREWIVSILIFQFNIGDLMYVYLGGRKDIENSLNNAVEKRKSQPQVRDSSKYDQMFESLEYADELTDLWGAITTIRNDLAHCGMNKSPSPAKKLKQNALDLYPILEKISELVLNLENKE
ncbi:MAG: TIGR02221 family CRISPR-associated protein [Pseudanabaena sp.]